MTTATKNLSTREGYGDGIVEAAKTDDSIVVLCADLTDSTKNNLFEDAHPERFFEVGIAEQNMAGIAAGLGNSGKTAFIASYAVFNSGRTLGQIRLSICYSNSNVKIVSSHAGLSASADGATHQALEDVAIMRVMPNMTVIEPADYFEAKKATIAASKHKGPVYLRLFREKKPSITNSDSKFEIGKATLLQKGSDVTIIGAGPILNEAIKATRELKKEKNIICEIINCATIKPLDEKTILNSMKKTKKAIVVEEHQIAGGLGGAVCELLSTKMPVPVRIVGVKDEFGQSGTYDELLNKYELTAHYIKEKVFDILNI